MPNTEISLDVENGLVVSIFSHDHFCFKSENLIGMKVTYLLELMSSAEHDDGETTEYADGEIQTVYEFDELGLQVWESVHRAHHYLKGETRGALVGPQQ